MDVGTKFSAEHDLRVGDLDNPLSIDRQHCRRPCAGGRPTAGGRLLLRPISQMACRKSPAGAVMMAGPCARPSQKCESGAQGSQGKELGKTAIAAQSNG